MSNPSSHQIISEVTADPAFWGGVFGRTRNAALGGLAVGAIAGMLIFFGTDTGDGNNQLYHAMMIGVGSAVLWAFLFRLYALGHQRDYVRMLRLRNIDADLLQVLEAGSLPRSSALRYQRWIRDERVGRQRFSERRYTRILKACTRDPVGGTPAKT